MGDCTTVPCGVWLAALLLCPRGRYAPRAAMLGGNLRVGLEDSLYIGPGKLAQSNADQVRKIRSIVEALGLKVATPDQARERLGLKGGDQVGF